MKNLITDDSMRLVSLGWSLILRIASEVMQALVTTRILLDADTVQDVQENPLFCYVTESSFTETMVCK